MARHWSGSLDSALSVRPKDIFGAEDGAGEVMAEEEMGEPAERVSLEPDEGLVVRKMQDPKLPSAEEVSQHFIRGHLPYRSWCSICVQAQGKDMDHRSRNPDDRALREYHWG